MPSSVGHTAVRRPGMVRFANTPVEKILSATQSQNDTPPSPGGDPDQPPGDLPAPPPGGSESDPKGKDKTGYGHIGNKETPPPDGAPPPHEIF
jgi:hypothetical protein